MIFHVFEHANQGCIYLIIKNVKYYYNLKSLVSKQYILKCNLFLWSKHHYSSLQSHMILQKSF